MIIYFCLYLLIIVDAISINKFEICNRKEKDLHLSIIFFIIVLVLSLRHPSMGKDLFGYIDSFNVIAKYSVKETIYLNSFLNYGWGYVFYNKLLSLFSNESQVLIIVSAILSIVPIGLLIKKESLNYIFSTIVYLGLPFFMMAYSGLRQAIAIGFCCIGLIEIKNKNIIRFAFLIFTAFLFHSSALIFLLAYPLYYIRLNKSGRIFTIILLPIIYLFRFSIFIIVSKLFNENSIPDNNNSFVLLIVFILIYSFCALFQKDDDFNNIGMLNIFYFACVCQCFSGIYNTAMRLGFYFMPALVITLPNIVTSINNRKDRTLLTITISVIFIIYGLFSIYNSSWAQAYPYHFFWENL